MLEVLRYLLFGLEVWLMGRLFWSVAVHRIFNRELYRNRVPETPARRTMQEYAAPVCERKAG